MSAASPPILWRNAASAPESNDMRKHIIAVAALLAATPSLAWAHAHLSSATPGENAFVDAPGQVTLGFTQALEKRFSTVEVRDASCKRVDEGKTDAAAGPASLILTLPKLPAGVYEVIWHATSVDTHRTEGSFRFTVKP
jgi:methionine-rich copper-binding protein CopC